MKKMDCDTSFLFFMFRSPQIIEIIEIIEIVDLVGKGASRIIVNNRKTIVK